MKAQRGGGSCGAAVLLCALTAGCLPESTAPAPPEVSAAVRLPEKAPEPADEQLAQAAAAGEVGEVRTLLERGADPNGARGTPLLDAMKYRTWSSRPDFVERYRQTIELLIGHGACVNVVASWESHQDQYTPLSRAAGQGDLRLVKKLVARGAQVNPDLHPHALPLYQARQGGFPEVVRVLIRAGAR